MSASARLLLGLVLVSGSLQVFAQNSSSSSQDADSSHARDSIINDTEEYNAYTAALGEQESVHRTALLEGFLSQYPQSVARLEIQEQLLGQYWRVPNLEKLELLADQILEVSPDNLYALAAFAETRRERARTTADASQAISLAQMARAAAKHGLNVLESTTQMEGVSQQDFDDLRSNLMGVFCRAAGFGALKNREFADARDYYLKTDLKDAEPVFELATAELEMEPLDINGFWYGARAASLARSIKKEMLARQFENDVKARYQRYHGGLDGWVELLRSSSRDEKPPGGFTVSRYRPPAAHPAVSQSQVNALRAASNLGARNSIPCNSLRNPDSRIGTPVPGSVPASVTSFGSDGRAHGVPASVTSPVDGQSHGTPASVSSIGTDCSINGVPAGITSFVAGEFPGVPASISSPVDGEPHGVPAGITSFAAGETPGVPASVSSPFNGQLHGVPASVSSVGVDGSLHGVPASIASPGVDGTPHGVSATIGSPGADGTPHGVPASIASPGADGTPHGVPGSISLLLPGVDGAPRGMPAAMVSANLREPLILPGTAAYSQSAMVAEPYKLFVLLGNPHHRGKSHGKATIPLFARMPK